MTLVVCTLNEVFLCRSNRSSQYCTEDDRFYLEVTQENWRRANLPQEFSRKADAC